MAVTIARPILTDEEREKRIEVTREICRQIQRRIWLEKLQKKDSEK